MRPEAAIGGSGKSVERLLRISGIVNAASRPKVATPRLPAVDAQFQRWTGVARLRRWATVVHDRQRTLAVLFSYVAHLFRLRCSRIASFNARSASVPGAKRAFAGVPGHRTTGRREARARRPLSSGGGAVVSFPYHAPFRALSRPWPRPRRLRTKPASR